MKALDSLKLVVASPGAGTEESVIANCARAIAGGATTYWLRERQRSRAGVRALAQEVRQLCSLRDLALWIAGDLELALEIGADAVHLGFADESPGVVRRRLGAHPRLAIGFSAHDPLDLSTLESADYVTLSPLFETQKSFPHPALGEARFAALVAKIAVPVVALGGIGAATVERALAAGASGVAVLRGVAEIEAIRARLDAWQTRG